MFLSLIHIFPYFNFTSYDSIKQCQLLFYEGKEMGSIDVKEFEKILKTPTGEQLDKEEIKMIMKLNNSINNQKDKINLDQAGFKYA